MSNQSKTAPIMIISTISLAIVISVLAATQVGAQSSKSSQPQATSRPASGNGGGGGTNSYGSPAPSPVAQFRQQQQQQTGGFRSTTNSPPSAGTGSQKRRPQQQQQPVQQTQYSQFNDDSPTSGQNQPTTEDPLADSEPALYGSVAGQPGVDFPAYTRIPKTSFTCEGKGFDFGFYADEEAACQVYHVCWEGRRESFLCGIGTVFNQAILACDYWHSVDCSKSSQFYGVNSELGKSSAEPASGGSQRIQQPARTQQQATLPSPVSVGSSSTSSSLGSPTASSNVGTNFGEPINQRRVGLSQQGQGQGQQPVVQQQQFSADDSSFNQPQQIQVPSYKSAVDRQPQPATPASSQPANSYGAATFAPQRVQQQQVSYDYQQQRTIQANDSPVKTVSQRTPAAIAQVQAPMVTSTSPPPPVKRPRFNMDFNQKVNSLIDSPVRPPIKGANQKRKQQQQQQPKQMSFVPQQQPAVNNNRVQQQQQQQTGSYSKKGGNQANKQVNYQQQQPQQIQQQQIPEPQRQEPQQQQTYDNELDEPQQQQQTFDDSPVQTSTVQTGSYNSNNNGGPIRNNQAGPSFAQVPQQAIQTIRSGGGSSDGSSAITTQYDTMSPPVATGANSDQSYESQPDDQYNSSVSDDFRSAGAKAAASQNQNWYIMRSI